MRLFLLTETAELAQCAILEDRRVVEFYVERKTKKSLVGNIYKAKVKDVLPGMDAAFVDIGWDRTAYLFISEVMVPPVESEEPEWEEGKGRPSIAKLLKKGEEILVQVVRDPIGSKGPRVTSFVSLPGRYIVLMPFSPQLGVSRRIGHVNERKRLRKILKEIKPQNMGVIGRTMAEGKSKQDLLVDLEYLLRVWHNISHRARKLPAPSPLYEELELGKRLLRDLFDPEKDKFLTDSPTLFRKLRKFSSQILGTNRKVKIALFSQQEGVFAHYHVDEELERALSPQVSLRSGGDLTIHETEALVSIDVNTGRYTGAESLEETAFKTNMEAAEEVFRQIQLRNLAGIIVVDFIDMRKRDHKKRLENLLYELAKRDRAHTQISRITEFGLVQMTRQKVAPSISHLLSDSCPFCKGSGKVKSLITLASEVESRVKRILRERKAMVIKVVLNPDLYDYITERNLVRSIGRIFPRKIILEKKALPWGEYSILTSESRRAGKLRLGSSPPQD